MPSGEVISNRQFRNLVRQEWLGRPISSEKFTKLNALVNRQVAVSKADLTTAQKRERAWEAAKIGMTAPAPKSRRNSEMHVLLRELEMDEEDYSFWWDEHES
jgi:hypothetical protein